MTKLAIREIRCSTLLHRLNYGSSSEYTANFYRGCSHGCIYCYAPSLIHDEREWGTYVDVKINAPHVLDRELRDLGKEVVFLSSASDPYQPIEARYRITRLCLNVLLSHDFPVSILTRSPLILRDTELLRKFRWIRVGFSVSTVSDRFYEPGVAPLDRRLDCLKKLNEEGIETWVSLAPIIPKLILLDIESLFERLSNSGVCAVVPGLLRFQGYEDSRLMFEKRAGVESSDLSDGGAEVLGRINEIAKRYGLKGSDSIFEWKQKELSTSLDTFLSNPFDACYE